MNKIDLTLAGNALEAHGSGALYWRERGVMVVSDLHLGKSERIARLGGGMLPPYETQDTLVRLDTEIAALSPKTVICLGDSFDDLAAHQRLPNDTVDWLNRLMAGRRWIWIEGNHDPGPLDLGGTHMAEVPMGSLTFRHIAKPGAAGEISGHYHPKATINGRGRSVTRACFLHDGDRLIMPAFGTYTGGLRSTSPELQGLMRPEAMAILTGPRAQAIPMPGKAR